MHINCVRNFSSNTIITLILYNLINRMNANANVKVSYINKTKTTQQSEYTDSDLKNDKYIQ